MRQTIIIMSALTGALPNDTSILRPTFCYVFISYVYYCVCFAAQWSFWTDTM